MVYASYPLNVRNDAIRRALIMVHGTNRNADHYFDTAMAATFLAGALDDTIVVAPHLIIASDQKAENEVVWPGGGDSWRSGGMSPSNAELSSFDVADELLRTFANKNLFPNMKAIVVTGHSAGGQYATRYAMANKVHDSLGVPVTYVVANPSSYAWPDATRTLPQDDAEPAAAKDGWSLTPDTAVHTKFTYGPYDGAARNCANYNRWPLGLENRTGYTAKMTDDQLKKQLVARPTTFLVGPGGHAAAWRLRQLVLGDGAGSDTPFAWRSVREVHQRKAGRDAPDTSGVGVRPQRPLHLHDGCGFCASFFQNIDDLLSTRTESTGHGEHGHFGGMFFLYSLRVPLSPCVSIEERPV
jgi:pimeloyl-ACP methyl ester carboxylesterase